MNMKINTTDGVPIGCSLHIVDLGFMQNTPKELTLSACSVPMRLTVQGWSCVCNITEGLYLIHLIQSQSESRYCCFAALSSFHVSVCLSADYVTPLRCVCVCTEGLRLVCGFFPMTGAVTALKPWES